MSISAHTTGVLITALCSDDAGKELISAINSGGGGTIVADADAATIAFDFAPASLHSVVLGGNRTLALASDRQSFTLILQQDATGSRTVTWWAGIIWPSNTIPTLTTTANKRDIFTFLRIGTGSYLGFTAGLNY